MDKTLRCALHVDAEEGSEQNQRSSFCCEQCRKKASGCLWKPHPHLTLDIFLRGRMMAGRRSGQKTSLTRIALAGCEQPPTAKALKMWGTWKHQGGMRTLPLPPLLLQANSLATGPTRLH